MTKSELIKALSEKNELNTTLSQRVVDSFFEVITRNLLSGDRVEIRGFGTFSMKERKPRLMRNPKTGEAVAVGSHRSVVFHAGKQLLNRLNGAQ